MAYPTLKAPVTHHANYPYNDREPTMTDDEVRAMDANGIIDWDAPIMISLISTDDETRYGCRLCISRFGLMGEYYDGLPRTIEEFELHRKEIHNL